MVDTKRETVLIINTRTKNVTKVEAGRHTVLTLAIKYLEIWGWDRRITGLRFPPQLSK